MCSYYWSPSHGAWSWSGPGSSPFSYLEKLIFLSMDPLLGKARCICGRIEGAEERHRKDNTEPLKHLGGLTFVFSMP